jgi:methyl acetate hydrolase
MSTPSPQLKSSGKQALDDFLSKTVSERKVPAAFLGATNKDGELYFKCGGERVFGKPDEGDVTPDTSKLISFHQKIR